MKYLGVSLLTLLFALGVGTSAQDNPFGKGGQGSGTVVQLAHDQTTCPDYKIIIITPPKDIDFKITLITPSRNIDEGIVSKMCSTPNQLSFALQTCMPPLGTNWLSTGNLLMSGQGSAFMSGQGNVFMPGKIK